jgi:hypothetical protein
VYGKKFFSFLLEGEGGPKVECMKKFVLVNCPIIWVGVWEKIVFPFFLKVKGPQECGMYETKVYR